MAVKLGEASYPVIEFRPGQVSVLRIVVSFEERIDQTCVIFGVLGAPVQHSDHLIVADALIVVMVSEGPDGFDDCDFIFLVFERHEWFANIETSLLHSRGIERTCALVTSFVLVIEQETVTIVDHDLRRVRDFDNIFIFDLSFVVRESDTSDSVPAFLDVAHFVGDLEAKSPFFPLGAIEDFPVAQVNTVTNVPVGQWIPSIVKIVGRFGGFPFTNLVSRVQCVTIVTRKGLAGEGIDGRFLLTGAVVARVETIWVIRICFNDDDI